MTHAQPDAHPHAGPRRPAPRLSGPVQAAEIQVPENMAAAGMETAVEVVVSRSVTVIAFWRDGIETGAVFSGSGSPAAARAKCLQRAFEAGLRLRARWACAGAMSVPEAPNKDSPDAKWASEGPTRDMAEPGL